VCGGHTVVTVLNYPHLGTGSYERDDSNARARCNEERITDGFVPLSAECASVIFCINSSAENKEARERFVDRSERALRIGFHSILAARVAELMKSMTRMRRLTDRRAC